MLNSVDSRFIYVAGERGTSVAHLKFLLRDKANITAQDEFGDTAIHRAVRVSNNNAVIFLVEENSDLSIRNMNNETALDIAIKLNNQKLIDYLKFPTQAALATDIDKYLLYSAKIGNFSGVTNALLSGANLNSTNVNGVNALHFAAHFPENNIVKLLIRAGIDVNALDNNSSSALDFALVKFLPASRHIISNLIIGGINYNKAPPKGDFTYLYKFAYLGYEEQILLMRNISNIDYRSEDGDTALHIAAAAGHDGVVRVLLARGANISIKNNEKETAYDVAFNLQKFNITKEINNPGTKLMQAAINGKMDQIKYWTNFFKTPNVQYFYNQTALNLAVQFNQTKTTEYLLEIGAQPLTNAFGEHPLFISAKEHNCYMSDILMTNFIKQKFYFMIDEYIFNHLFYECNLTKYLEQMKYVGSASEIPSYL